MTDEDFKSLVMSEYAYWRDRAPGNDHTSPQRDADMELVHMGAMGAAAKGRRLHWSVDFLVRLWSLLTVGTVTAWVFGWSYEKALIITLIGAVIGRWVDKKPTGGD